MSTSTDSASRLPLRASSALLTWIPEGPSRMRINAHPESTMDIGTESMPASTARPQQRPEISRLAPIASWNRQRVPPAVLPGPQMSCRAGSSSPPTGQPGSCLSRSGPPSHAGGSSARRADWNSPGNAESPWPGEHCCSPDQGLFCSREVRRRPTLPQGPPCSTIGAERLSFRVRNVTGRFPLAMTTGTPSTMIWSQTAPP